MSQSISRQFRETSTTQLALEVLAELGIIVLLFRVSLESDIGGLLEQLPRARSAPCPTTW